MLKIKSLFFISFLLATSPGGAQQEKKFAPFSRENIKQVDRNADRQITFEEFSTLKNLRTAEPSQRKVLFDRLDRDGDGVLSAGEVRPPNRPQMKRKMTFLLQKFDHNEDGKISRAEFLSRKGAGKADGKAGGKPLPAKQQEKRIRLFTKLDQNQDGYLSREDRRPLPQAILLRRFDALDQNQDATLDDEELQTMTPPLRKSSLKKLFKHLDANRDQRLSQAELQRTLQKKNSNHTPPVK